MTPPLHREFAAAILLDPDGRLLLQQRDDVPGIRYPGRIGLFGGHREGNETFLECVCREIDEELGLRLPPERFDPLASYSAVDPEGGRVTGEFFIARNIAADGLLVTEGALLIATPDQLPALQSRFAPAAWSAVGTFMSRQSAA
jgi:8-oxo-dGTP pyrophosphatase MutT (NUDIX family)